MKIKKALVKDYTKIKRYNFELNRDWKSLISSKESSVFVLETDNKIIGFSGLTYHKWNNTFQVITVFVAPEYRRKKYGTKLIEHLIKKAKKTKARCIIAEAPSNNPVVLFYKKLGFRKCGHNDRYYDNKGKEIAYWMSFDLE